MPLIRSVILITITAVLSCGAPHDGWRGLPARHGVWRGTPVQYKVLNGWALVEGDILLAPAAELDPALAATKPGNESSIVRQQFRVWPGNVIPFTIDDGLPRQERVRNAIQHWQERTPIRFVERTTQGDWVTFRSDPSGCSSNVGLYGGQQFVNLASACDTDSTIHEIGHAVGLWHTQSRTDRDGWIRIRYESIDKEWWSQFDRQISNGRDIGPYPFNSVMHYSAYAASKDGAQVMVSVPPGIPIGQEGGLTPLDVYAVHQLYSTPLTKTIVSSTPLGLNVKVDGVDYKTPAEFDWAAGETHRIAAPATQTAGRTAGVRYDFAGWTDGGSAEHAITISADEKVFDVRYRRMVQLTTTVTGGGGRARLTPESVDGYYPAGTRVRVHAEPGPGSAFLSWCTADEIPDLLEIYLNGCSLEQMDIDIDTPVHLSGAFTAKPATTITSTPPGRLVLIDDALYITPIRFAWEPETDHELYAISSDSSMDGRSYYEFARWSEGDSASLTVKAGAGARTITATYDISHEFYADYDYYISSGSTRPGTVGFTLNPPPELGYYRDGTEVQIIPPQDERWQFVNWYLDLTGTELPGRVKVMGYTTVVGNFLSYGWLNAGSITHDAKRQPDLIAPGQRVRLYWNGHVPDAPVEAPAGQPLPTVLGGVDVRVNRQPAPLVRVSKNEIVFVVPASAWTDMRTADIGVNTGKIGTLNVTLAVMKTNPGIYTADGSGTGPVLNRTLFPGEEFTISATGLTADEPVVAIFGQTDQPASAEPDAKNPGIWHVRTRVPEDTTGGPLPLYLLSGNKISQPGVRIDVQVTAPVRRIPHPHRAE